MISHDFEDVSLSTSPSAASKSSPRGTRWYESLKTPRNLFASSSSSAVSPTTDEVEMTSFSQMMNSAQRNNLAHLQRQRDQSEHSTMKKTLDWKQLISLGIGCTVGAGIFAITSEACCFYSSFVCFVELNAVGSISYSSLLCVSTSRIIFAQW